VPQVRSNDEAINWCLAGFDFGDKAMPLVIVGSGTGGTRLGSNFTVVVPFF
jgi:hypothetical protein